jgi:hypothetical protein
MRDAGYGIKSIAPPIDYLTLGHLNGGRGRGNRTPNLRFWRPTLCQLSYTPTLKT